MRPGFTNLVHCSGRFGDDGSVKRGGIHLASFWGITMRTLSILILPLVLAGAGCTTTTSLARHTVNQSVSAADFRYEATLHALAMVAAEPATLPSYALLSGGTASISDTGAMNFVSTWSGVPSTFASQALSFTGTHAPQQLWSVSPVADFTQLEAMRCACHWVLTGQDQAALEQIPILASAEEVGKYPEDSEPGYHPRFDVASRLARLPLGWLRRGRLCEIPHDARYKAHCGDTWVWVMPDGMEGLAGFTLVLQDIATLDVAPSDNSTPSDIAPPILVTLWNVESTVPKPSMKPITIIRDQNAVIYPEKTDVIVGQSVIWKNSDPNASHAATSTINGLFDTTALLPGTSSKPILFDDTMFSNAGGYNRPNPNDPLEIEYYDKGGSGVKAKIVLYRNQYTSIYSPTLVFREDRVVKPCYLRTIQELIEKQINNNPTQPVQITYDQWLAWTLPYQGQRTAVKPGTPQAVPVTVPVRLLPSATVLKTFRDTKIEAPVGGHFGPKAKYEDEKKP